jgi:hypothetical protein
MKNVFIFIALFITAVTANAQRLYIHDMLNGNYKSFGRGDRIEFTMLDSTSAIKGRISRIESDKFYIFGHTNAIKPSQVATLILRRGASVGNVLAITGGSILIALATPAFIVGTTLIIIGEPEEGIITTLISGAIISVGTLIVVNQSRATKRVKQSVLDNKRWRLFID